jgi:hypothetical protein
MDNPERGILADRELLNRVNKRLGELDLHPLARRAYEADARYLHENIDRYEKVFAIVHDL